MAERGATPPTEREIALLSMLADDCEAWAIDARDWKRMRRWFEAQPDADTHDGKGLIAARGVRVHPLAGEAVIGMRAKPGAVTLDLVNAALDACLAVRVAAHRARGGPDAAVRAIDVPTYLLALRFVRHAERVLDPWRAELGAVEQSRAYELVTTDTQLSLGVAA